MLQQGMSAGKFSTVTAHLGIPEARKRPPSRAVITTSSMHGESLCVSIDLQDCLVSLRRSLAHERSNKPFQGVSEVVLKNKDTTAH